MTAISAGSRSNSLIPPASMSARSENGLTAERRVTIRSGSPSWRMTRPATSTSTMSPRWTLSSMPLRICRARIGGTTRPRAAGRVDPRPGRGLAERQVRARSFGLRIRSSTALGTAPWRARIPLRLLRWDHTTRPVVPGRPRGEHALPEPPRLAASGGAPQARDPARRAHRTQEVPRGRPRAVVVARLRGAGRRQRQAARDPDAARDDDRRTSSANASASCRSCGRGSGWSTRCSS